MHRLHRILNESDPGADEGGGADLKPAAAPHSLPAQFKAVVEDVAHGKEVRGTRAVLWYYPGSTMAVLRLH